MCVAISTSKEWLEKKRGEINYNVIQVFMEGRRYLLYLYTFMLDTAPDCSNYGRIPADLEWLFLHCVRLVDARRYLEKCLLNQFWAYFKLLRGDYEHYDFTSITTAKS